jgi:hypothetical protein
LLEPRLKTRLRSGASPLFSRKAAWPWGALFAALAFFAVPRPALALAGGAAADAAYVDALVAKAHAMKLADDPQWIRLGHWRRTLFGGWKSEADGIFFFLAKDGDSDPSAELDATLRGVFGVRPARPDEIEHGAQPAFCRFPARMAWLNSKLGFDAAKLAAEPCPKFEQYWSRMAPESASLIFSSYYLNNPASAFGHTFLRMRKHQPFVSREKRELLDYGVDYSAEADTGNPIIYAFKGLTGLFKGTYKVYPYYYKVREYNDYESRDLWEYDLNLTDAEVVMLAAHLYELGSTYFDYFYLDENCSYHILGALEAAAPRLQLLSHIKVPVVPADTVKALYANPGLVKDVRYRPSAMTQFRARIGGMSGAALDVVQTLSINAEAPIPASFPQEEQVRVLDAAADLVDIRFAKDLAFEGETEGGRIKRRLLERRATILVPSPDLVITPPLDKQPHVGHGSSRLWGGFGYQDGNGAMYSLGYRLALHDLADPADGYPDLADIEFLPTELRLYPKQRSFQLEKLDVVSVVSLHEMTRFDHRLSWRIHTGVARVRDDACDGCAVGDVVVGSGATLPFAHDAVLLFAMLDMSFEASAALHGIRGAPGIRGGVGPYGGLRLRLGRELTWLTTGHAYWLPGAYSTATYSGESTVRWEIGHDVALGVEGRKFVHGEEGTLQAYIYF